MQFLKRASILTMLGLCVVHGEMSQILIFARSSSGALLYVILCFLKARNPLRKLSTKRHLQMKQPWSLLQRTLVFSSTGVHRHQFMCASPMWRKWVELRM
uniref:Uncharacterized protein n=1 Tax=Opuntia streptacantha TaxID=393608 RepID=A0A7C9ARP2_OPUST